MNIGTTTEQSENNRNRNYSLKRDNCFQRIFYTAANYLIDDFRRNKNTLRDEYLYDMQDVGG